MQGSGLGLAIVKRLVELMGGRVTVASVPGQGSVFHLRFPGVPVSARLAATEKNRPEVEVNFNELCPATLLVVDDNELNRQLIAGMLAGSHHRLLSAASGEEALAKARQDKPDVVLLDLRLPGISGRETLRQLRQINGLELTPVIAVTASALLEGEPTGEEFSGYVRKPFTRRELFEELAEFLPAQPKDGAAWERPAAAPPGHPPPAAAPELSAQLRELLIHPWPSLRDRMAVNECRAFAQGLERLGRHGHCPPLVHYARTILRDAETYAVADLENHLGQFAAVVEQLARDAPE
jgi:CheY-like chemotaxis protein